MPQPAPTFGLILDQSSPDDGDANARAAQSRPERGVLHCHRHDYRDHFLVKIREGTEVEEIEDRDATRAARYQPPLRETTIANALALNELASTVTDIAADIDAEG